MQQGPPQRQLTVRRHRWTTPVSHGWCHVEHRATPSDPEPHTGWAQGDGGRVRERLRFVRLSRGGDPGDASTRPDQRPVTAQATEPIRRAGADVPS